MEIVVEDPRGKDNTRTYQPTFYRYEEPTQNWSLLVEREGEEVELKIPRERVICVEKEPEGHSGAGPR